MPVRFPHRPRRRASRPRCCSIRRARRRRCSARSCCSADAAARRCWPASAGAGCRPPPARLPGSLVMAVIAERPVRGRLFPGARRAGGAGLAYLAYLSRPDPQRLRRARVVSGGPAAGGHVALWRRAAGADAAADRRQLRRPARAAGASSSRPLVASSRARARPAGR